MAARRRSVILLSAAAVLLLSHTASALKIWCGCNQVEMKECESWGPNPICELSYFAIGDIPATPGVRSVSWFSDGGWTAPFPNAATNTRTADPFPMLLNATTGQTLKVNCSRLGRTIADPVDAKFVSARVTTNTGATVDIRARFSFTPGTVRDPADARLCPPTDPFTPDSPRCRYAGIARDAVVASCPPRPAAAPRCQFRGTTTLQVSALTTHEQIAQRLAQQCDNSVLNIQGALAAPLLSSAQTPMRIWGNGVTINAPRLIINFQGALPDTCMIQVYGSNVTINGLGVEGKAGMCICSGAQNVKGNNMRLRGPAGNLIVEEGASMGVLTSPVCNIAMAEFCIINKGSIDGINNGRFSGLGAVNGGAILNMGYMGDVAGSDFSNAAASAGGNCGAAAGVIVNSAGAVLKSIDGAVFTLTAGGRSIWNDGKLPNGIRSSTFSGVTEGAIANGPSGVMGDINGVTMTSVAAVGSAAGVLNFGAIGSIAGSTFSGASAEVGGIVIGNEKLVPDLASCGAFEGPASIASISGNTFESYQAGLDSLGAISNEGGVIGDFSAAWAAIVNQSYVAPAGADGIVGNTFRGGVSTDPRFAIANRGKVSHVAGNTFANILAVDSGAALENAGQIAFVGANAMQGVQGDAQGAIQCANPEYNFGTGGPLSAIKLLKANTISRVPGALPCVFIGRTCGVQMMYENRCNRVAPVVGGPAAYVFEPRPDPLQPRTPAGLLCASGGNTQQNAPVVLGRQGLGAAAQCPIRQDGLWFQPAGAV